MFYVDRESSALPILFPILCGIIISAFSLQIIIAITLIYTDSDVFSFISKFMIIFSCCVLMLLIMGTNFILKRGREIENNKEEYEYRREIDPDLYYHPIDKQRA